MSSIHKYKVNIYPVPNAAAYKKLFEMGKAQTPANVRPDGGLGRTPASELPEPTDGAKPPVAGTTWRLGLSGSKNKVWFYTDNRFEEGVAQFVASNKKGQWFLTGRTLEITGGEFAAGTYTINGKQMTSPDKSWGLTRDE